MTATWPQRPLSSFPNQGTRCGELRPMIGTDAYRSEINSLVLHTLFYVRQVANVTIPDGQHCSNNLQPKIKAKDKGPH